MIASLPRRMEAGYLRSRGWPVRLARRLIMSDGESSIPAGRGGLDL
jgi:hypothetical protein